MRREKQSQKGSNSADFDRELYTQDLFFEIVYERQWVTPSPVSAATGTRRGDARKRTTKSHPQKSATPLQIL